MADSNNDTHGLLYFMVAIALCCALWAAKNTFDIKWTLKNEAVQCK